MIIARDGSVGVVVSALTTQAHGYADLLRRISLSSCASRFLMRFLVLVPLLRYFRSRRRRPLGFDRLALGYAALNDLDANAGSVAIEHLVLQNDGWERDSRLLNSRRRLSEWTRLAGNICTSKRIVPST